MTLRSGGGPRNSQAHPKGPGEERRGPASEPRLERDLRDPRELRRARETRSRSRRSGGFGLTGLLKFLAFALVLAAVVVVVSVTVMRPVVARAVVGWAADNPAALRLPFVADLVREDIGTNMTAAASSDRTQVEFTVEPGDTATSIAERLAAEGLLNDARAFVLTTVERELEGELDAGSYLLRRNMTPDQLVTSLLVAKDTSVSLTIKEGLRLEQIVGKLQTMPLTMDVRQFYELAKDPPAVLLADYPWLNLPKGASLEGFLAADTYRILPDTAPDELIRILLDRFQETVGPERMDVPKARGLSWYEVVTLASLVEREAGVDEERALIAGVYQNRLKKKMLLNADPTVIYGHDTVELDKLPFEDWQKYFFWAPVDGPLAEVELPKELAGYQTYVNTGLMPGPIATPTAASIDAALKPDTADGYLYFVAKGDGSNTHAFAKTYKEHLANLKKYGY
jgi:UPF0755 protein